MNPSLAWVQELHGVFARATEATDRFSVEDTVNPLVKHIVFHLSMPLPSASYMPFQNIAHAFAKANNCLLERIYNKPDRLVLVVGMKRRLGPVQNKNPLLSDKKNTGGDDL